MEDINSELISDYIRNEVIFKIGQDNFNNGLIQLEFIGKYLVKSKVNDENNNCSSSIVGGCSSSNKSKNRVMIEFKFNDGGGIIKKSLCTCLEFEFTSPCRHVVATCFELIEYLKQHPNRFISNNTLIQEYSITKSTELSEIIKEIYIENPILLLYSTQNNFNNNLIDFNNFNGIDNSNNKITHTSTLINNNNNNTP